MRLAAGLAALLVLAGAAGGAVDVRQTVATTPWSTVPVTLGAGLAGSTTVGASGTSAVTTGLALPLLGSSQALVAKPGPSDWTVRARLQQAVGTGALDSLTVSLVGPTTETQVAVTAGLLTQASGKAVALTAGGTGVQLVVAGTCVGTCTLSLHIELQPAAGGPLLLYPYTLTVT